VAKHLDKRSLNRVLGIGGVAAAPERHAEGRVGVTCKQHVHRLAVAAFRVRAEQGRVVGLGGNRIHLVHGLCSHSTGECPPSAMCKIPRFSGLPAG
jgi:hypothetical protein